MNTTKNAAQTTLEQLGGANRLRAMIGLGSCYHTDEGMTLSLAFKNPSRSLPNNVRITLGADDLYTIKTCRVSGLKLLNEKTIDGVDVANLKRTLETITGLAWSL